MNAGRIKLIATVGRRFGKYPELPSLAELGYPQVEGKVWYGVSGPAGIPKPVVARNQRRAQDNTGSARRERALRSAGADATFLAPDDFVAFMKAEWAKWGPVVRAPGAKVD